MLRKVMLVGFIAFFKRGTASQLIAGILWCLTFMIMTTRTQPYRLEFSDSLVRPSPPPLPCFDC